MRQAAERRVSLGELAAIFEATCCACGMDFSPEICSACPALDVMKALHRAVE